MLLKIACGLVAIALMLGYLVPVAVKLREISLAGVIIIGLVMMLTDMWQSLRSGGD